MVVGNGPAMVDQKSKIGELNIRRERPVSTLLEKSVSFGLVLLFVGIWTAAIAYHPALSGTRDWIENTWLMQTLRRMIDSRRQPVASFSTFGPYPPTGYQMPPMDPDSYRQYYYANP